MDLDHCCLRRLLANPLAVKLSTWVGVAVCGWPISSKGDYDWDAFFACAKEIAAFSFSCRGYYIFHDGGCYEKSTPIVFFECIDTDVTRG